MNLLGIAATLLVLPLGAGSPAQRQQHAAASADTPHASALELRRTTQDLLRRHAKSKGPERIALTRELIALHQQIGANAQLPPLAQQQMQRMLQARLRRAAANDDYGPELVDLIERTIAPGTWESQGGPGRIYYWRNGRALVVSQTQSAHEALADLVKQLHAAGN